MRKRKIPTLKRKGSTTSKRTETKRKGGKGGRREYDVIDSPPPSHSVLFRELCGAWACGCVDVWTCIQCYDQDLKLEPGLWRLGREFGYSEWWMRGE